MTDFIMSEAPQEMELGLEHGLVTTLVSFYAFQSHKVPGVKKLKM